MSRQLVSHHLRELHTAGPVAAPVAGRSKGYTLCCLYLDDLVPPIGGLELAARWAAGERVPDPSPA
jgi:hypothetical protein